MKSAVVGSPIAHSLSPALHRAAYAELGLDWSYDAVEVAAGELAAFVDGLDAGWAGLSVTMPGKREALELARVSSETARLTNAANTLLPLNSGWIAENTDVPGMVAALVEAGVTAPARAAVLGGGATAASTVVALARFGVREVVLVVRRPDVAEQLRSVADRVGLVLTVVPWEAAASVTAEALVVSTVPQGAADTFADALEMGAGVLFDVVYDPWPTPLATAWVRHGGQVIGGLDLLVHQAVLQVELMTGRAPSVGALRAAGLAVLAAR